MTAINWSNVTDLGQLPAQANVASGGAFWTGMMYMGWIIMILMLIGWGFEIALLGSSFAFLVIGLLLVYSDLVAWTYLLPMVGVILIMFLYIIYANRKTG